MVSGGSPRLTLHVTLARSPADNSPNENGVIAGGTETHPYAHTQATTQFYSTSLGLVVKRTSSRDGQSLFFFSIPVNHLSDFFPSIHEETLVTG